MFTSSATWLEEIGGSGVDGTLSGYEEPRGRSSSFFSSGAGLDATMFMGFFLAFLDARRSSSFF